jgi:DNA-binding CsgD family transcriptional regulator
LDKHWNIFKDNFENLNTGFFGKLSNSHPGLTQQDLKHCALIKMNLETKEIATLFNIKPSSVQMSRVRLKKKLGLSEKKIC